MNRLIAILLTGIATIASASQAQATVLSGPISNPANGHSYYVVDNLTWTAAEAEAVTLGGHLATINDAAENQWVFDNLSQPAGRYLWLGLNDIVSEGTFVWTSGEPVTYTNWGPGEPNNLFGIDPPGEDYTIMLGTPFAQIQASQWNDVENVNTPFGAVEVVPEPGSLILAGSGLIATLLYRVRRREKKRVRCQN